MTTSEKTAPDHAFVWIWLPGAHDPVVAGRLEELGEVLAFTYARSYVARPDAVPLYLPELPLGPGRRRPASGLDVAGCIADAAPDAWGRRVILARHLGHVDRMSDTDDLSLLTYLLESGSDRIGALDFQASPTEYIPRSPSRQAGLEELMAAADHLQAGTPLSPDIAEALVRGTSIGGARPKALLYDGGRSLIAKFSSSSDTYPVVKAEAAAMWLAQEAGIRVPASRNIEVVGKDVLVVERFDRDGVGGRRQIVSALTMLGLSEMTGRYATYPDLADLIRARFTEPTATLRELFTRIVFNVAVGNNDDHARNHAAFWDGTALTLTPAYDLCPQPRSGNETAQAMAIGRDGSRDSRFSVCVAAAGEYLLDKSDAQEVVDHVVGTIDERWPEAADTARLTQVERDRLWHRQILNESVFY
ncbi:HipA domain-containing protein [Myceligenerans crystallogenes]|uniref:Type II toxin-antitoxin system HipA family toxin n=1 Tax=Myceligenerans crystallogenes TaxID=316335 RepID=A0ABN2NL72_9MICO